MYRVTVWLEKVQTEILGTKEFQFLCDARCWCEEDFETRAVEQLYFVTNGGYTIDELVWKHAENPEFIRTPSLKWKD